MVDRRGLSGGLGRGVKSRRLPCGEVVCVFLGGGGKGLGLFWFLAKSLMRQEEEEGREGKGLPLGGNFGVGGGGASRWASNALRRFNCLGNRH